MGQGTQGQPSRLRGIVVTVLVLVGVLELVNGQAGLSLFVLVFAAFLGRPYFDPSYERAGLVPGATSTGSALMRRRNAALIDFVWIFVALTPVMFAAAQAGDFNRDLDYVLFYAAFLAAALIYLSAPAAFIGSRYEATPGMKREGLKIVDAATYSPIGFARAFKLRALEAVSFSSFRSEEQPWAVRRVKAVQLYD